MLNETRQTIEHNGEKVFFSVSPCSWMNKGYGLQVSVSLKEHACNAESEFIRDKSFEASDKSRAALDKAAKVMVEKWLNENGTAALHEAVAKWSGAREKFAAAQAEAEEALKENDKRQKAKGYTHRVDAWIHPPQGDDYEVTAYVVGAPTKQDLVEIMRSSTEKDDYTVVEL